MESKREVVDNTFVHNAVLHIMTFSEELEHQYRNN